MSKSRGRRSGRAGKAAIDPTVLNLFQEAMGSSDGRPSRIDIVAPKFDTLRIAAERFTKATKLLSVSPLVREGLRLCRGDPDRLGLNALRDYNARLQSLYDSTFATIPDLARWRVAADFYDYGSIPKETRDAFLDGFSEKIRQENPLVQIAVSTCKNLTPYKHNIQDGSALDDGFIVRSAGGVIAPIDGLPAFNLKATYLALNEAGVAAENKKAVSDARRMVLLCVHKIYVITYELYEGILMPDIDPDEFTGVIAQSIASVRKHIPRCDAAFDKILESTSMLKGNFSNYYKDYAASNDPTIILQNFVVDVSRETKGSTQLARQFRTIISHYRKLAGSRAKDPRLQALFGQVSGAFGEMEKADRRADEEGPPKPVETAGGMGGAGGAASEPAVSAASATADADVATVESANPLYAALASVVDEPPADSSETPAAEPSTGT